MNGKLMGIPFINPRYAMIKSIIGIIIFANLFCLREASSETVKNIEEMEFYNKVMAQWELESAELKAQAKPERGRHNTGLLEEFLKKWPASKFADDLFLMLTEETICIDWNEFPDCGLIEVKAYEEFLNRYPESNLKEEVMLKMANAYYQMAYLWVYGRGIHSEKWSDIFRSQSLKIVLYLKKSDNEIISKSAGELSQKLLDKFPRPIAPIPEVVLSENYL